jgi:hypothetical protein
MPATPHMRKRRHRSVHVAEISHFRDAAKLSGAHLVNARIDGHHGAVHPNVDATPFPDHAIGSAFHRFRIRDICRQHERRATCVCHIRRRTGQSFQTARDEPDAISLARKLHRSRPAHTGRCACDHYHFVAPGVVHFALTLAY